MPKASEEISKYNASSGGKTDSNLANDALHLNGIPAEQYATKKYVQDYHGTKEAIQKEYIDEQNKSKLEEAKAYTDQVVAGQDFSNFAKVTDVQAVDTKLTNKINEDMANQKAYTDNKTQAVVNDVNNNFNDVHNAISTLNANQKELFQSVSSGKSKVAGAITDKGVSTFANDTFDTMANNIRNIQSGGSAIDPNFVNTSDATAIASDILVGKTAYAQGNKIYGTLIAQEAGVPTYGTDTSNATATSSDIAYGKTAYARGQLLVGTMQNTDVQEILGVNTDSYEVKRLIKMDTDPVTGDKITSRRCLAFSKNLDYCVSATQLNNDTTTTYIESYAVNSEGMYVQGSSNASGNTEYKKYRYTLEELGISGTITDIGITAGGVNGDSNICYLIVVVDSEIHVFTYHTSENGVIGKMYESEQNVVINATDDIGSSYDFRICTSNLSPLRFTLVAYIDDSGTYGNKLTIVNYKISVTTSGIVLTKNTYGAAPRFDVGKRFAPRFSIDDKYIEMYTSGEERSLKIDIDNNYTPSLIDTADLCGYLVGTNYFVQLTSSKLNLLEIYEEDGDFYTNNVKTLSLDLSNIDDDINSATIENYIVFNGNKNILAVLNIPTGSTDANNMAYYRRYLIELDISNIFDDNVTNISVKNYELLLTSSSGNTFVYFSHNNELSNFMLTPYSGSKTTNTITDLQQIFGINFNKDSENLLGLIYKGQYFYNHKAHQLTAGQGDVRNGKTFIGWMGYPEIGTMEVSE